MTQRKPNLRSVREVTPQLQFRTLHGYRRAFRIAGSGPVILLIHGIGDNSTTWETVQTFASSTNLLVFSTNMTQAMCRFFKVQ